MKAPQVNRMRGFSFVELMAVLGIMAILGALAVPAIKSTLMEGKAPEVGKVIQVVIDKARAARLNGDTWASASDAEVAKMLNSDGRVTITGSGASTAVLHGLGDQGTISFAPGTITSANDAGQLTISNIHESACAPLANTLSKYADVMTVNGTSVKAINAKYMGSTAQTACVAGETNALIVLFR